jgi:hypothetical protein
VTERVEWEALPSGVRRVVEARTGPVVSAQTITSGLNCTAALVLHCRNRGPLFLKGVRTTDEAKVAGLRNEAQVNAAVTGISPALRHSFEVDGWFCLAFAYVPGRHVDLSPGAADLTPVTQVFTRMQGLDLGDLWRFGRYNITAPDLADQFAGHLRPGEAAALKGTHLLHTDTNPHNILVGADGGQAYVVDWAMPAVGPAWVDPAYTAVRMMECDRTPADALRWLSGFASWRDADPAGVETLVNVTCRQWTAIVGERDAEPSNARYRTLLG